MGKVIPHANDRDVQAVAAQVAILMESRSYDVSSWYIANGITYTREGHAVSIRLEARKGLCVTIVSRHGESQYPLLDHEIMQAADLIVRNLDINWA